MKYFACLLLLLLPTIAPAQTIPDPTPAQLQALLADMQTLAAATSADLTAQALVVSDSAVVSQAQTTLTADISAQSNTAAAVGAAEAQLIADVQALSPVTQAALRKALQAPQFAPGPHDFHGGEFHGGPGPWISPIPWIAPVIVNYATAPRYVTNPATGQAELRTPGQWVQPAPGQWAWQALPIWPLSKAATKTEKPKPERLRPLHRLVIHLHLL